MRDVISNETIKEINEVIDEILTNIDDNVRNIQNGEGNSALPTLFSFTNYSGQIHKVHGSIFRNHIIIDNADGNSYSAGFRTEDGDIFTTIGDKNGKQIATVDEKVEGYSNLAYFRESYKSVGTDQYGTEYDEIPVIPFDITHNYYTDITGFSFDILEQSNSASITDRNCRVMSFKLANIPVGSTFTVTFGGQFHGSFSSQRNSYIVINGNYYETGDTGVPTPIESGAMVEIIKDDQRHNYSITCTMPSLHYTDLYLHFYFDVDSFTSFDVDSLLVSGMDIGIIRCEVYHRGKWYMIATGGGGGTSDLDAIELTYAEYQQLSSAEKLDPDKIYFITDYPSGSGVVINPTGTATDTAETIEVDGTIYNFAGTDADAVHTADIGVAGGVAELDSNGKVPSSQLPSYVDDVEEYANISTFPATGESGKIYIALDTNKTYRWTGSVYVEISPSLALGETSSTAYRGDRGKIAYDHSQSDHSGIAPTFTEASTRANIASGETFATLLGKIKKFFSDLKAVAFTGAYADLSGTPTIPTVNNGTLTIKRNNTSVGTFTANQSGASNINIECATPSDVEGSKTATGSIVTVTDAADIYAEEVDVAVVATQTGSGTPSPSNIRPIQGYDIVSVDRCGKNLFDRNDVVTNKVPDITNNGRLMTQNGTDTTEHFIPLKPSTTYTVSGNSRIRFWLYGANGDYLDTYLQDAGQFTTNAQTYFIRISGNSGWQSNSIQIEKNTSATTYEPYNGQTISLQLGNKNLLPMTVEGIKAANTTGTWSGNVYTQNNVSFTVLTDENGCVTGIKANASTAASANTTFYLGEINKGDGDKYINGMPATGSGSTFLMAVYVPGGSAFSGRLQEVYGTGDTSFNGDSDSRREFIAIGIASGYTPSNLVFKPMLRKANIVDSTFSPYNPTLGGMVYGGQLTLKDDGSAVFVGDRACVDLGSLEWNMPVSGGFSAQLTLSKSGICSLLCSVYGYDDSVSFAWNKFDILSDKTIFRNNSQTIIYCKDTTYTDATAFKTAVIGQQLVYELATPFTIYLSAEQLKLLQGTNNVWSNAGDVTLKYQPDNVIAEPKADVQRLRDDVDDRLVGNACINRWNFDDYLNYCKTVDSNLAWTKNGDEYSINNIGYLINAKYSFSDVDYPVAISIKMKGNATSCYILGYDINGTEVKRVNVAINANTFTDIVLTANCSKVLISYGGSGGSVIIKNPQIEIGSSPSAYEEYYPSNRELANLVDSSLVKCNPTTDYADRSHYIDISAYDDNKPIFGYVYLAKGAYIRYCPVWLMKDWGTDEPSNTIITAHVTSYFKFTFYYNNSPRRVMLAEVKDYNDDDVSGYNAIRLYLYRNY